MKKIVFVFGVLIVCVGAAVMTHKPLLGAYARFFSVATGTKGADAIVVLSGRIETRFPRALELYRQGYAPRILLTDPRLHREALRGVICDEHREAEAMLRCYGLDVPLATIPSDKGGATSTFDEAYDTLAYCLKNRYRHIIIVTDEYHTRRSLYAFKKIFKQTAIKVESMGAANDIFTTNNWWRTDRGIEAYVLEPVKLAVYWLSDKNAPFIKNY